ncbi:hypothetical protein SAMD00019534_052580 [Acytostelium subglobosum LB1]|uniref:hypothetical protein n=1 Tax=Acytostelium subglobosum LB1 TaxID=1410327 RepID=UPI00064510B2|nr:hypothetical protein SAMD00019534_052580 [Acytostelium subglobosum LB1]GAM22083.1 hypothetical protein SAMD00019534_052580 [Acytostelium subglobosum LB1]|eukprot:XP_012755183.1 hypothetical protein SAMD00019534_052580 [Acytostelium subglobosum LB1]
MKVSSRVAIGVLSTILFGFGVAQIVMTWAYQNLKSEHTWAYFANGFCCVVTGICGIVATFVRRERVSQLFFIFSLLTTLEAIVVYIIYSRFLPRYIKNSCGGVVYSEFCQGITQYLAVSTTLFWAFIILLLPLTTFVSWKYTVGMMKGDEDIEMDKRSP